MLAYHLVDLTLLRLLKEQDTWVDFRNDFLRNLILTVKVLGYLRVLTEPIQEWNFLVLLKREYLSHRG